MKIITSFLLVMVSCHALSSSTEPGDPGGGGVSANVERVEVTSDGSIIISFDRSVATTDTGACVPSSGNTDKVVMRNSGEIYLAVRTSVYSALSADRLVNIAASVSCVELGSDASQNKYQLLSHITLN